MESEKGVTAAVVGERNEIGWPQLGERASGGAPLHSDAPVPARRGAGGGGLVQRSGNMHDDDRSGPCGAGSDLPGR